MRSFPVQARRTQTTPETSVRMSPRALHAHAIIDHAWSFQPGSNPPTLTINPPCRLRPSPTLFAGGRFARSRTPPLSLLSATMPGATLNIY